MKLEERLLSGLRHGNADAFEEFAGLIVQETLRMIPHVVENVVKQAGSLRKLSGDFYERNPQFAQHKGLVAKVLEGVEAENPGRPYGELLDIAKPRITEAISGMDKVRSGAMQLSDLRGLDSKVNSL